MARYMENKEAWGMTSNNVGPLKVFLVEICLIKIVDVSRMFEESDLFSENRYVGLWCIVDRDMDPSTAVS